MVLSYAYQIYHILIVVKVKGLIIIIIMTALNSHFNLVTINESKYYYN